VLDVAAEKKINAFSDGSSKWFATYLMQEVNDRVNLLRQDRLFCNEAPTMKSSTHGNICRYLRFPMIILRSSMRHLSFKADSNNIGIPVFFDSQWDCFMNCDTNKIERSTEGFLKVVMLGMFCNFFNGTTTGSAHMNVIKRISRIALNEEKRSFSVKLISLAFMILKSHFNTTKPSPRKSSVPFKCLCAKMISLVTSATRLKRRIDTSDKCRFVYSLDVLVCATLHDSGRRLLITNHWDRLSFFLENFIRKDEENSAFPSEVHVLCLKLLGNLSISKTHKIEIVSNDSFLNFIVKMRNATDKSIQHAATTALLCLLHKSEKAVAILKKERGEIYSWISSKFRNPIRN